VGDNKTATLKISFVTTGEIINYAFPSYEFAFDNASITKRVLTVVSVSAKDKIYDGTVSAKLTGAVLDGLQNGESLTLGEDFSLSCEFVDKNAALSVALTLISSAIIANDKSNNYEIASSAPSGTAKISPKVLNITAKDTTVTFDGYAHYPEISAKDGETPLDVSLVGGEKLVVLTGIFDETATVLWEILLEGASIDEAIDAGIYGFTYSLDADAESNYVISNGEATAVLTVEKISEEEFKEIISRDVVFNDDKVYVYTEGTVIVPRVVAMEIAERYGITLVSVDTEAISHMGIYPVRFTFVAEKEQNFEINYYTVNYIVEARPVKFTIKRETGKITVVDPIPGARFCLVDTKGKKVVADWQTSPIFNKISDTKTYTVKMELYGSAVTDYAPDKTEINSAAIRNDLMIWIIVAMIIALIFILWFLAMKNRKSPQKQRMGMMPYGPTMPMAGFTAPKLPQAPGLKKPAQSVASAPKKAAPQAPTQKAAPQASAQKAAPKARGQQLIKAKPVVVKRETVPMVEMKFVRNSAHYGGKAKSEKSTVMRDKTDRD
jgi:hypothetical protein